MNVSSSEGEREQSTVLVVDDDDISRTLLTNLLETNCFRVRGASNGEEALGLAAEATFDTVLLDVVMPGIDGIEVCRRLKSDPRTAHVPVILVTSISERDARLGGMNAGADEFVTKPYDPEEVVLRVRNATRTKRLYDQVRENLARLEDLEELRDNMTNMIVHDMRNPLSVVTMSLDFLDKRAAASIKDEDRKKFVSMARQSAFYLANMVGSMLDICKLESGTLKLDRKPNGIGRLIEEAVQYAGLPQTGAPVHAGKPDPEIEIACDAELVRRVIINLIGNAKKFTPEHGSIRINVAKTSDSVRISVADTGLGIPKEHHERIFQKFVQVESTGQIQRRSTGLGLTFCKLAVEAHGGTIGVESQVGVGSTFTFSLPLQPTAAA